MCITPVDGTSRRKRDQMTRKGFIKVFRYKGTQYNISESSLKVARKQSLAWAICATPVLNILGESGG